MNHILKFLLFLALLSSGCAPLKVQNIAAPVVSDASKASAKNETPLPAVSLSPKMFYEFLLGEIAGQRGELALASDAYIGLAKTTRDPRVAERASQISLFARQDKAALEAARLWLEIDPDSIEARQTVTALLVNRGHLDEARPYLENLLAGEKTATARGFLHLNSLFSKEQDRAAALALVKELSKPYANLAEAHFAVAQAAATAGELELARQEINVALSLRPGWESGGLLHAQILQRVSATEALKYYQDFLKTHPRAQDMRLAYARYLVSQKNYVEARVQFKQLMADFPANADVSVAVGLLSLQLNDYDAAQSFFKQALEFDVKDPARVMLYLGQVEEERKQYTQAVQWYGNILAGEFYIPAQIRLAGVLAKSGKLAEARKHLTQINAANTEQRVQLIIAEAQLLREAKAFNEAFKLLDVALAKYPTNNDLLYDHAMAAEKLDKLDIMERDLRQLIKLKPDYAHAYNALGYTFADRTNRLAEAMQLIEKALILSPEDAFIMDSMGWLQYRMGQHAAAVDYLKRAYALRPDPEIAAHLGEALWAYGKPDEALGVWQEALQEHPGHEGLLNAMSKFKN